MMQRGNIINAICSILVSVLELVSDEAYTGKICHTRKKNYVIKNYLKNLYIIVLK